MMNYRLPHDPAPQGARQAPAPAVNPWTDGLDPARLERVTASNRAMVYTPPSAAAIQDNAIKHRAAALWARTQAAVAQEYAETFQAFGEAMQAENRQRRAEQAKAQAARRQREREEAEAAEERRANQQAAVLALSADTNEAIAAIRQEIDAIVGVSRP